MAKQTLNITLTGEAGLAGNLSQEVWQTTPDINLNYTVDEGEMASGIYNPLMRIGYLFPAHNSFLTINVPSITDEWTATLVDPEVGIAFGNQNDNAYTFDNSFVSGIPTYTYDSLDGVKIDTAIALTKYASDFEIYQVNGVKKVFFTNASATGNLGIMTTTLGTPDFDWLSTVCSGGTALHGSGLNAFMLKADNGLLYVFDDYAVHEIDGTALGGANGIARMDTLLFPSDLFEIADAVDTKGRMFIALNESSTAHNDISDKTYSQVYVNNCGVYVWNKISTSLSVQDYVTIEDCSRINRIWVGPNGEVFLMTLAANGNNQIRLFDGGKFVVVKEMPFETKIARRDGLLVAEKVTFWAAIDGYIYAGKMIGNKFAVYKIAQYYNGTQATPLGSVLAYAGANSFSSNTGYRNIRPHLLVAYKPASGDAVIKKYYIYGIDSMTDANGSDGSGFISPNPFTFTPNQGDVYTGVYLLPTLANVYDVVIRCIPTPTGATEIATIKYYFNNSSTASITKTVTLNHASKGYVSHAINKQNINSIQIEIEWKTAVTMGVNTFAPYIASVSYEKTDTYSGSDV